jgi:hypothetical protein
MEKCGDEGVQLYIRDILCKSPQTIKELKGFCRVEHLLQVNQNI